MAEHACQHSTWEMEAGGSRVQGQPRATWDPPPLPPLKKKTPKQTKVLKMGGNTIDLFFEKQFHFVYFEHKVLIPGYRLLLTLLSPETRASIQSSDYLTMIFWLWGEYCIISVWNSSSFCAYGVICIFIAKPRKVSNCWSSVQVLWLH